MTDTKMSEAFVYCWTDTRDKKLYIGSHKGSIKEKLSQLGSAAGFKSAKARPHNYSEIQSARIKQWWKERKALHDG